MGIVCNTMQLYDQGVVRYLHLTRPLHSYANKTQKRSLKFSADMNLMPLKLPVLWRFKWLDRGLFVPIYGQPHCSRLDGCLR